MGSDRQRHEPHDAHELGQRRALCEHAQNALNQSVTQGWDAALGVPRSLTDANGITITWSYGECGAGCVGKQNKLIVSEIERDANDAVITERRVYTERQYSSR